MADHFIDDNSWKLHNVQLGIFLHEGGTTAEELETSFINHWFNDVKLGGLKIFAAQAVTTDITGDPACSLFQSHSPTNLQALLL